MLTNLIVLLIILSVLLCAVLLCGRQRRKKNTETDGRAVVMYSASELDLDLDLNTERNSTSAKSSDSGITVVAKQTKERFEVSQAATNTAEFSRSSCQICMAGGHLSFECQLTLPQREELLHSQQRCLNCFGPKHDNPKKCWSGRCLKCGKEHHLFLCTK